MAREQTETAIGYISEKGDLVLAPPGTDRHVYAPCDKVIIIGNRVAKLVKHARANARAAAFRSEEDLTLAS